MMNHVLLVTGIFGRDFRRGDYGKASVRLTYPKATTLGEMTQNNGHCNGKNRRWKPQYGITFSYQSAWPVLAAVCTL